MAAREIRAAPRRLLLLTAIDRRSAWPPWSPSTRSPTTCATRSAARPAALLGADLALSQPAAAARAPRRPCSTRSSRAAAAVARLTSFSGMAYVPAHQRHPARAGGGRRGGLSVLRRDPDGAGCGVERAAAGRPRRGGPVAAHRTRRAPGRHAVARRRPGSSSAARSSARPATSASARRSGRAIYISAGDLPATHLLGFGSRAEYEAYVRLPADRLARGARPTLPARAPARAGAGADGGRGPAKPERRAGAAHRLPRAGRAHRAAARRDRRGERGRGVHPPAARYDRRASLPRRERATRARGLRRRGGGDGAGRQRGRRRARGPGAAPAARPAGGPAAGGRPDGGLAPRRGARASGMGRLGGARVRAAAAARRAAGAAARGAPPRRRARARPPAGSVAGRGRDGAGGEHGGAGRAPGGELAPGRHLLRRRRRGPARALGCVVGADPGRAALASRHVALRVAAGRRQPASALEPDDHRRAGHRLRRLPAGHPLPGAVQPAAHTPAERRARRGPIWYCSTSSPTSSPPSSARPPPAATPLPGRCRSCPCASSRSTGGR